MKKLEVVFTKENEDDVLYMVLRLFFGKYDESNENQTNYKLSEFGTQEDIIKAISVATNNKKHPAQSAVSKRLAAEKGTIFIYKNKEYRLRKVNGHYKMTDTNDFVAAAKLELSENRKYLSKAIFRSNISDYQPSTFYAFKLAKDNISISKIKDIFNRALGDSYFGIIEHNDIVFLLLNTNSKSVIADSKWLNDYFNNYSD